MSAHQNRFIGALLIAIFAALFFIAKPTWLKHDPTVTAHGVALGLTRDSVFQIIGKPDDRERVRAGTGTDYYTFGEFEYRNGFLCRVYSDQIEVNGQPILLSDALSRLPAVLGESVTPVSKVYKYISPSKSFLVSVQYDAKSIELSVPIRSGDRK